MGLIPDEFEASIEFENVTFFYPSRSETKVLKSFNLSIKKGECVAIVGASGSGKSTAIKLLQRFYDVSDGKVCHNHYWDYFILRGASYRLHLLTSISLE